MCLASSEIKLGLVQVKYLPGIKLPNNVVATSSLAEAVDGATALIFVLPHQVGIHSLHVTDEILLGKCIQFIPQVCKDLKGKIRRKGVKAISLIKVSSHSTSPISFTLINETVMIGGGSTK